jgi:hypothetical protein
VRIAQISNSLEQPVDCSAKRGARDYANAFDSRLQSGFVSAASDLPKRITGVVQSNPSKASLPSHLLDN